MLSLTEESRDKKAGDSAFASKDYAIAASFYGKYLEESKALSNRDNTRDAYERILDALVLGRMPELAEKYLQEYETAFPGANPLSLSMWRADIMTQLGQYENAKKIYERILPGLPLKDPRRLRTLFSYGIVLEHLKNYKGASKVYENLYQQIGASPLGKLAFERNILCMAAADDVRGAMDRLLSFPADSNASDFAAYRLLNAYILLKSRGAEYASGVWSVLLRDLKGERDSLVYLVASAYGDAYYAGKNYPAALDAYRAAFSAAADKAEAFETLDRIIQIFSNIGNKKEAAALASKQLELFKNSLVKAETKLKTARLLAESGNLSEALQLYESIYGNINSTAAEKRTALRGSAMILTAEKRPAEAETLIRSHFTGKEQADGEFLLAEVLVASGRTVPAMEQYQKIAERWKDHAAKAYYLAASSSLDAGMPDRTLVLVEKLKPLAADALTKQNLLFIEAVARERKNERNKARALLEQFFRSASKENPLLPQALYQAASLAFSAKDAKEAEMLYSRIIKEFPKHSLAPLAAFWLIHVYYSTGDEISAERETWLLASRYPDSEYAVNAIFRLASHYADAGAGNKAEAALDRLLKYDKFPQIQARALFEKALQAQKSGDAEGALKLLNELYERFPDTVCIADAYYLNGDILNAGGSYAEAIAYYVKAMGARPDSILECAALGSIGDCMFAIASAGNNKSKSELSSAISYYTKLIRKENCPAPFVAMATYKIGHCFELLGNDENAANYYKQLLYKLPAKEADSHPAEMVWSVKAAEALVDLAARVPMRATIENARFALHWLTDAKLFDRKTAETRFEQLKQQKFNP